MTMNAVSPITASVYVALGGAIGALGRYQIGRAITYVAGTGNGFPWGTMTINILGSLSMGVLMGWLARSNTSAIGSETIRLFLGVGLLGGFTTFSAFSAEMITLAQRGQLLQCFAYGSVSLLAGMAAFLIGLVVTQGAVVQSTP